MNSDCTTFHRLRRQERCRCGMPSQTASSSFVCCWKALSTYCKRCVLQFAKALFLFCFVFLWTPHAGLCLMRTISFSHLLPSAATQQCLFFFFPFPNFARCRRSFRQIAEGEFVVLFLDGIWKRIVICPFKNVWFGTDCWRDVCWWFLWVLETANETELGCCNIC